MNPWQVIGLPEERHLRAMAASVHQLCADAKRLEANGRNELKLICTKIF